MQELITVQGSNEILISSRDIASLTNKEHRNVCRDIEVALEEDALKFEQTYNDSMNRSQRCYVLPKNIALGIVSGYSFELRMKIINRLEQLENEKKNLFSLPQTFSEALLLAAKQAEQIEQQIALISLQATKVDFYEAVTGSTDTIDIGTVAKVLNIDGYGRTRLFAFLRDKGVLRANNEPYQTYIDRGYFRVIESKFSKPDGSSHVSLKTVVYQKGVDYIRKLVIGAQ
jgi:anti-repressor protein